MLHSFYFTFNKKPLFILCCFVVLPHCVFHPFFFIRIYPGETVKCCSPLFTLYFVLCCWLLTISLANSWLRSSPRMCIAKGTVACSNRERTVRVNFRTSCQLCSALVNVIITLTVCSASGSWCWCVTLLTVTLSWACDLGLFGHSLFIQLSSLDPKNVSPFPIA